MNGKTAKCKSQRGSFGLLLPGQGITGVQYEYWRRDHLGNTRVAFSDLDGNHFIALREDVNMLEQDEAIYYLPATFDKFHLSQKPLFEKK